MTCANCGDELLDNWTEIPYPQKQEPQQWKSFCSNHCIWKFLDRVYGRQIIKRQFEDRIFNSEKE